MLRNEIAFWHGRLEEDTDHTGHPLHERSDAGACFGNPEDDGSDEISE